MNRRIFEILAVVLTGTFKFVLVDYLNAKFWFILVAGFIWCGYIIFRIFRDRRVINDWGFGFVGFGSSVKIILIPAMIMTLLSIWYGTSQDQLIFNWHIIPIMVLYPLWGTVQQFLIISLFGGNLAQIEKPRISLVVIIGLTSTLFSVVHYPSTQLIGATFLLAIFYMLIFLRFKNLWALGLFHGWLGCIFYFFVLGRDPWVEFIGSM